MCIDHSQGQTSAKNQHINNFNIFQTSKPPSLVLGGTQTHKYLICVQTPKPSCLGTRQEDSCLPKVLI